jgi:hypothetical protein
VRRQLNGEERRDGDLTMMDDEERRERDGNSKRPTVGAIKANASLHYKM